MHIVTDPKQYTSQFIIEERVRHLFTMPTQIHNLEEVTPLYGLLRA